MNCASHSNNTYEVNTMAAQCVKGVLGETHYTLTISHEEDCGCAIPEVNSYLHRYERKKISCTHIKCNWNVRDWMSIYYSRLEKNNHCFRCSVCTYTIVLLYPQLHRFGTAKSTTKRILHRPPQQKIPLGLRKTMGTNLNQVLQIQQPSAIPFNTFYVQSYVQTLATYSLHLQTKYASIILSFRWTMISK